MVPQFTPMASEKESMLKMVKKKKKVNVMTEESETVVDIVEVGLGFLRKLWKRFFVLVVWW
jgi:hypothetical protein